MTGSATPQVAAFGSWKSPVTTDLIVGESVRFGQPQIVGDTVYWLEHRPAENGRCVIVRRDADGVNRDLTPAPFNVRTRVHEYGGGAYLVHGNTVYFSNFDDQCLYRQTGNASPVAITAGEHFRYADAVMDTVRQRLILVREDHSESTREPVNQLVAIDVHAPHSQHVLSEGADFYSSPRIHPDGSHLAWVSWSHPNMPWDGTDLWVAAITADGSLERPVHAAGGAHESVAQPVWKLSGAGLVFVSDRSGWWNLYLWREGESRALYPLSAEFSEPQWELGQSTYACQTENRIVCTYSCNGESHLAMLDIDRGVLEEIPTPYREILGVRATSTSAVFEAGSPFEPASIVKLDLQARAHEVLRRSSPIHIERGYVPVPEAIEFPTANGLTAHAFYYAPHNRDFRAPEGVPPPLLVINHGGPTLASTSTLKPIIAFWTSRGFAVVDVNYGGSSGYGREYRRRLNGQWGIVDVEDSINVVRHLVSRSLVDSTRLAIRGGSAGGFTCLAALTFHRTFQAGASYFGIADLEAMARDTHKFESRYLDSLVGPYPEAKQVYEMRSPIHFTERLASPLILFQGLQDTVVPPNQARVMFDAVSRKHLPVALITFENEAHGFRRGDNLKRALEAELYFYGRVFGFDPADALDPITIENLPVQSPT